MITITTQAKFDALFAAVLLKRILVSNAAKIVLESDAISSKLSLDINSYSLENLVHEYERKFEKIDIMHSGTGEWHTFQESIQQYCGESNENQDLTFLINALEQIITEKGQRQVTLAKDLQKKLLHKNKLQYGLSLLPLQFAAR
ncbi:MAG: hypothetical protein ACK4NC_01345 [Candidatus Gracilibacteria bacterium]